MKSISVRKQKTLKISDSIFHMVIFLNNTYELWSPEKAIIPCICISWLLKIENLMLKMCICPRLYIHTQS